MVQFQILSLNVADLSVNLNSNVFYEPRNAFQLKTRNVQLLTKNLWVLVITPRDTVTVTSHIRNTADSALKHNNVTIMSCIYLHFQETSWSLKHNLKKNLVLNIA